jgi:hypothetical protein
MPPHPVYAPRSNTVKKPMTLGPSMDGIPTQITLAGQNILIVASPGGGKSAIIRSLVDYVTSCTDAFAWDIDPTGRGLGPLRRHADRRAYTEKDIDEALDDAIAYAKARAELMGDDVDNWPVTDTSPAGFVFVDEHPQLTSKQKAKVIALMRIGRKARFTVALASQDATADVVGDAVADAFGIRIMLPCRRADVPLVVGSDTAISEGWMPHRLTPSPGDWDLADAGCFYIVAPGLADPILRKATFMTADDAKRRAGERFAAGLATVDPATVGGQVATDLPEPPAVLTVLREAFAAEDGATCLPLGRLHPHLAAADPARWDRWQDKAEQDRLRESSRSPSPNTSPPAAASPRGPSAAHAPDTPPAPTTRSPHRARRSDPPPSSRPPACPRRPPPNPIPLPPAPTRRRTAPWWCRTATLSTASPRPCRSPAAGPPSTPPTRTPSATTPTSSSPDRPSACPDGPSGRPQSTSAARRALQHHPADRGARPARRVNRRPAAVLPGGRARRSYPDRTTPTGTGGSA